MTALLCDACIVVFCFVMLCFEVLCFVVFCGALFCDALFCSALIFNSLLGASFSQIFRHNFFIHLKRIRSHAFRVLYDARYIFGP